MRDGTRGRERVRGWLRAYGMLGLQLALSYTMGFALGRVFMPGPVTAATASPVYAAPACAGCSAAHLTGVEVQQRTGSTLFVLHGAFPAGVDQLGEGVRLDAGDLAVLLLPHGSGGTFDLVTATRAGSPLAPGAVAAGLRPGLLLLNVQPRLEAPFSFAIGLGTSAAWRQRIPAGGTLTWSAAGVLSGPIASPRPVASPTPVPTPTPPDVTAQLSACGSQLTGGGPPGLAISALVRGQAANPRTGVQSPAIGLRWGPGYAPPKVGDPPHTVTAVTRPAGTAAPTGQARFMDGLGTLQLTVMWTGDHYQKAVRTWSGSAWTIDLAADQLTVGAGATDLIFYWAGINPGDRFGVVVAGGQGCQSLGIGPQGQLTGTYQPA